MKTWKKIEETKKRTNDITSLKKRNEEKVQKVCVSASSNVILDPLFRRLFSISQSFAFNFHLMIT